MCRSGQERWKSLIRFQNPLYWRPWQLASLPLLVLLYSGSQAYADARVSRVADVTAGEGGTLVLRCSYFRTEPVTVAQAADPRCDAMGRARTTILQDIRDRLQRRGAAVCLGDGAHSSVLRVTWLRKVDFLLQPMQATEPRSALAPNWLTDQRLELLCPSQEPTRIMAHGTALDRAEVFVTRVQERQDPEATFLVVSGAERNCTSPNSPLRREASDRSRPSITQVCQALGGREENWATHRCLVELNRTLVDGRENSAPQSYYDCRTLASLPSAR